MPKYFKDFCLQRHDEESCWNIHPVLYDKMKKGSKATEQNLAGKEHNGQGKQQQNQDNPRRGNTNNQQWLTRKNNYKRDRYKHILVEVNENNNKDLEVTNSFNTLEDKNNQCDGNREKARVDDKDKEVEGEKPCIKDWVDKNFDKNAKIQQGVQDPDQMNTTIENNDNKEEIQQREVQQEERGHKRIENQQGINKEKLQKDEEDKKIQLFNRKANELMVIKGISPIAIQSDKLKESYNDKKEDLDGSNLDDNINQVSKVAYLSPKKIESLKDKQGKSNRKNKSSKASSATIHTRSHTSKIKS